MEPIFRIVQKTSSQCIERQVVSTFRTRPYTLCSRSQQMRNDVTLQHVQFQGFSTISVLRQEAAATDDRNVKHDGSLDRKIGQAKELQNRTPWHREGADQPPVKRMRSAGAITKGISLLFTLRRRFLHIQLLLVVTL